MEFALDAVIRSASDGVEEVGSDDEVCTVSIKTCVWEVGMNVCMYVCVYVCMYVGV